MALIELTGITKLFGERSFRALELMRSGADKAELLAATGDVLALRNVTLAIERGEIFVVMGLSGSGKSTLVRHINRLIDPTSGSIRVDGTDVLALSIRDLVRFRRGRMSMVFQHFGLFPHRTVLANVGYGLEVQHVPRRERERRALEWIEAVGLTGYESAYPSQLSGGMQQRVGLARALATDPEILLMDEAFSALDPLIRGQMQDLLIQLHRRLRKTIVFVTHDLDEALRLGDRIAILKDGVLVQVGRPADILLRPADDHVRSFVRDVNRARALTVAAVMRPAAPILDTESIDTALAALDRAGAEVGYLVTGGTFRGVVFRVALRQALSAGGNRALAELGASGPISSPGATLADALPAVLATPYPIPVVAAGGRLAGMLSAGALSEALAPGLAPVGAAAGPDTASGEGPLR